MRAFACVETAVNNFHPPGACRRYASRRFCSASPRTKRWRFSKWVRKIIHLGKQTSYLKQFCELGGQKEILCV
jgi:hypothetical protein